MIDIGVNLGHDSFDKDRDQVIQRAQEAGVKVMVVTGSDLESSRQALDLARNYPGILYSTAGVHPHNARRCDRDSLRVLKELAGQPQVAAIGECGLDYNRDFSPRPIQDHWFEAQLQLSSELRLPLFLHERDAHRRFLEILSPQRKTIHSAVVHCFTGTAEELDAYLALDLHIGITGWICDERRGLHLRELVRRIPLDRLMLETDAPYLAPRNMRPRNRRNEPAFLPYMLQVVADCQGKPEAEVAAATTATARAFFRLDTDLSPIPLPEVGHGGFLRQQGVEASREDDLREVERHDRQA